MAASLTTAPFARANPARTGTARAAPVRPSSARSCALVRPRRASRSAAGERLHGAAVRVCGVEQRYRRVERLVAHGRARVRRELEDDGERSLVPAPASACSAAAAGSAPRRMARRSPAPLPSRAARRAPTPRSSPLRPDGRSSAGSCSGAIAAAPAATSASRAGVRSRPARRVVPRARAPYEHAHGGGGPDAPERREGGLPQRRGAVGRERRDRRRPRRRAQLSQRRRQRVEAHVVDVVAQLRAPALATRARRPRSPSARATGLAHVRRPSPAPCRRAARRRARRPGARASARSGCAPRGSGRRASRAAAARRPATPCVAPSACRRRAHRDLRVPSARRASGATAVRVRERARHLARLAPQARRPAVRARETPRPSPPRRAGGWRRRPRRAGPRRRRRSSASEDSGVPRAGPSDASSLRRGACASPGRPRRDRARCARPRRARRARAPRAGERRAAAARTRRHADEPPAPRHGARARGTRPARSAGARSSARRAARPRGASTPTAERAGPRAARRSRPSAFGNGSVARVVANANVPPVAVRERPRRSRVRARVGPLVASRLAREVVPRAAPAADAQPRRVPAGSSGGSGKSSVVSSGRARFASK